MVAQSREEGMTVLFPKHLSVPKTEGPHVNAEDLLSHCSILTRLLI